MTSDKPADTQAIARILEGADIVVQAVVLVQWTGDTTLLDEIRPHVAGPWDYMTDVPADLANRIRRELADRVFRFQRGELAPPPAPTPELARALMDVAVGQHVPDQYVPMLLEDIALQTTEGTQKGRAVPTPPEPMKGFIVTIIGGGMSGIVAAIKLKEAGIGFRIIEKSDALGGVWYQNTYPGCGVDTPSHFYSYSFARNDDWSHYFSKRDELFEYFRKISDDHGLNPNIELNSEVTSATYDDARSIWTLKVRRRDGRTETVESNAVIFAVGALNRPAIPAIPGMDGFRGEWCHTAEWKQGLGLKDRRVAIIGTGASAVQVAPAIAAEVAELTIFQRSPQWLSPNANYHRQVTEGKKWALKNVPAYASWYRFQLFWGSSDGNYPALQVDPDWPDRTSSINALNRQMRENISAHIRKEIGERTDLLDKVIPTYPPYGKRMLRDNRWYQTLKRPNVNLVTDPIGRITENSVVTGPEHSHPADVIIFATGFRASEMLAPIAVTGRGGRDLRSEWEEDDPRAYLGITVAGFPNLFILFGPNTVLAHGGSAIFQSECQVHYIVQALLALQKRGCSAVEVKRDVYDAYCARVDDQHSRMVWAHKGVNSWYKNRKGRVTVAQPWKMIDYWQWTHEVNEEDYLWS